MKHAQLLQERFAHLDHIRFESLDSGLILIHIDQPKAKATISLYGGQILEWHPSSQHSPVLWRTESNQFSRDRPIRAGVPICWPWFGPHPTQTNAPSHGFARTSDWELTSISTSPSGETEICMSLWVDRKPFNIDGLSAVLTTRISVGETLSISLSTTNNQDKSFNLTEALHAYFYVSDVRQVQIQGLSGCQYVDLIDRNALKSQSGVVTFSEETGRVYLNTQHDCLIVDRGLDRAILVEKAQSQSTVVWNPWAVTASKMDDLGPTGWQTMVCIESANALRNSVVLGAGETHSLAVKYSVQAL
ncbi:D-hexose-6-phosphate mutarotase [Zwartia sp.]|uniref:D-hexose-6-phosphate mutarotase n=1 Tax=Zwartia sp. TaxID=2978004 RepID=UPI002725EDB2|nr:D-hexose-6-phosphate mutarotase [Zwartia sp.]MDO9025544.1 D-hexose-6-phosphate mutarotase [Zwartia sp.]